MRLSIQKYPWVIAEGLLSWWQAVAKNVGQLLVLTALLLPGTLRAQEEKQPEQGTDTILRNLHVLKIEPLAPLTGNITFGYERLFKNGLIWESRIGIIAAHRLIDIITPNDRWGGFLKTGPKLPLFETNQMHPLQGLYFRPLLIYSVFQSEYTFRDIDYSYTIDVLEQAPALMLEFGGQFVIRDKVTVESYLGFGAGYSKLEDKYSQGGYHFSHLLVPLSNSGFNPVLTLGLSMGYVLAK